MSKLKLLQSDFTTPEQSKRLLELGVPADSADCYYNIIPDRNSELMIRQTLDCELKNNFFTTYNEGDLIPCWSVGRLIEIENICSIPKIKEAGFHLMRTDFDDLIETMIISIKMKVEHGWIDFSKLEEKK